MSSTNPEYVEAESPFDFEKFKSGKQAITRDGQLADFRFCYPRQESNTLVDVVHGPYSDTLRSYHKNGRYLEGMESPKDLVAMAPSE